MIHNTPTWKDATQELKKVKIPELFTVKYWDVNGENDQSGNKPKS